MRAFLVVTSIGIAIACGAETARARTQADAAPLLDWRIVESYPHDVAHYTQGLALHGSRLFESAGRYGMSAVYEKDLRSGRTLRATPVDRRWFAEGITVWRDRLLMLTWREHIAQWFSLDLEPQSRHAWAGEGWGLTHDAQRLIASDGSAELRFLDPDSLAVEQRVTVRDGGMSVPALNELEHADGIVYANVWRSDRIAAIDAAQGAVLGWYDLAALRIHMRPPPGWDAAEHVLNGIAYDARDRRFYVTGKCWPRMFALELQRPPPPRR